MRIETFTALDAVVMASLFVTITIVGFFLGWVIGRGVEHARAATVPALGALGLLAWIGLFVWFPPHHGAATRSRWDCPSVSMVVPVEDRCYDIGPLPGQFLVGQSGRVPFWSGPSSIADTFGVQPEDTVRAWVVKPLTAPISIELMRLTGAGELVVLGLRVPFLRFR